MSGKHRLTSNLLDFVSTSPAVTRPGVHEVVVLHDDWCPLVRRVGGCACDPVVEEVQQGVRLEA